MRVRAAFVGLALAVGGLVPVASSPGIACAAEQSRAVLVVDTGAREASYCVALDDEAVSGIELIVLAGRQHGLSYRLGYGGAAVCMLAGVGTSGDDCFEEYPSFWGYWRGNGSGGWSWSSSGAASTSVSAGDVEGWSWGTGDDGDSHPAPPATTFGDVCEPLSEPSPPKKKEDRSEGEPAAVASPEESPSPPMASAGADPKPAKRARPKRDGGTRGGSETGARAAGPAEEEAFRAIPERPAVAAEPASAEGPPLAGLGALAASVLLAAAGGQALRRRGAR